MRRRRRRRIVAVSAEKIEPRIKPQHRRCIGPPTPSTLTPSGAPRSSSSSTNSLPSVPTCLTSTDASAEIDEQGDEASRDRLRLLFAESRPTIAPSAMGSPAGRPGRRGREREREREPAHSDTMPRGLLGSFLAASRGPLEPTHQVGFRRPTDSFKRALRGLQQNSEARGLVWGLLSPSRGLLQHSPRRNERMQREGERRRG